MRKGDLFIIYNNQNQLDTYNVRNTACFRDFCCFPICFFFSLRKTIEKIKK